jgi:hypothetical protein
VSPVDYEGYPPLHHFPARQKQIQVVGTHSGKDAFLPLAALLSASEKIVNLP